MRALLPAIAAVFAFQGATTAQIVITEKAKPAAAVQDDATANLFYKAFYLDNGARQYDQALSLYKKFLTASPKSKLAPRAARNLVNLLYRTDKLDDAKAAQEKYKALLAAAGNERGRRGRGERGGMGRGRGERGGMGRGRGERGERGRGRGRGEGGGGANTEQVQRFKRMISSLEKQIAEAKEAGNNDQVARLGRQLDRIKGRVKEMEAGGGGARGRGERGGMGRGRGERGRGRGGRGGFGQQSLAEMSKDEGMQFIERMEGILERFGDRLGEERVAAMEKGIKECKKLIEAGKMKEAEKVRQEKLSFRRRR